MNRLSARDGRALTGIVVVWLYAFLPANLVPSLIGRLVGDFHLDVVIAGFVATGMTLVNAVTVLAVRPLVRTGRRALLAVVGAVILIVVSLFGILFPSSQLIAGLLLVAGVGSGLCLAAASAAISATPSPDRSASVAMIFNRLVVAAAYFLVPILGTSIETIFLVLSVPAFAVLATARWMPESPDPSTKSVERVQAANAGKLAWFLAGGMGLLAVTDDGIIGISEVIGVQYFGDEGSMLVLNLYAAATLAGLLGALTAPSLIKSLGYANALVVAMILSLGGKLALTVSPNVLVFSSGYLIWGFAFGLCLPIIFGLAAMLKSDGSASVAVNGVYVLGVALGPTIAAQLFSSGGIPLLTALMGSLGIIASIIMIAVAARVSSAREGKTEEDSDADPISSGRSYVN